MEDRHPDAAVHTVYLNGDEPRQALLGRRVDTVVTRLPMRTEGLEVTVLYDEPHEMLVFLDHRLASKKSVTLEDLEGEPSPAYGIPQGARRSTSLTGPRARTWPRSRSSTPSRTSWSSSPQAAASPSSGRSPSELPTRPHHHPLEGVEPSHIVIETLTGDRNPLVGAFRKVARNCLIGSAEAGAVSAVDGGT